MCLAKHVLIVARAVTTRRPPRIESSHAFTSWFCSGLRSATVLLQFIYDLRKVSWRFSWHSMAVVLLLYCCCIAPNVLLLGELRPKDLGARDQPCSISQVLGLLLGLHCPRVAAGGPEGALLCYGFPYSTDGQGVPVWCLI